MAKTMMSGNWTFLVIAHAVSKLEDKTTNKEQFLEHETFLS